MSQGVRTDLKYQDIIEFVKTNELVKTKDLHSFLKSKHSIKTITARSRLITKFVNAGFIKRIRNGTDCYIKFLKDYTKNV